MNSSDSSASQAGDRSSKDPEGMGGADTGAGAGDLAGTGRGAGTGGLGSTGDPGGTGDLGGDGMAGTEAGALTATEASAAAGPGDVRDETGDVRRSGLKPDTDPAP